LKYTSVLLDCNAKGFSDSIRLFVVEMSKQDRD